jgi:hypothetical protein
MAWLFACHKDTVSERSTDIVLRRDTISSTKLITPPFYPPLKVFKKKITIVRAWSHLDLNTTARPLGTRFKDFQKNGLNQHILYLIESIAALTRAMHSHLEGEMTRLPFSDILDARFAIQHEILCLPSGSEIGKATPDRFSAYECCRLTLLIYGIANFAIPNTNSALQRLSKLL